MVSTTSIQRTADTMTFDSGSTLDIGGTVKFSGTSVNLISAVGSGYKLARGETALDGSNPTPITTGLTTVVAFACALKGTSAPGVGTCCITYGVSGGTVNLYGWKPTATNDCTLIASTGTEIVGWVAIGT